MRRHAIRTALLGCIDGGMGTKQRAVGDAALRRQPSVPRRTARLRPGVGAALVQAGLLSLAALVCYWRAGAVTGGGAVACLFLVRNFGLFGSSLVNTWCIVAGVGPFARYEGEPFASTSTPPSSAPRWRRPSPRSCSVRHCRRARACSWRSPPRCRWASCSCRPRRTCSRRLGATRCTASAGSRASSARWWWRCTSPAASYPIRCPSGPPGTTACSAR